MDPILDSVGATASAPGADYVSTLTSPGVLVPFAAAVVLLWVVVVALGLSDADTRFALLWTRIAPHVDRSLARYKKLAFGRVYMQGTVLEVGPGLGETLQYYVWPQMHPSYHPSSASLSSLSSSASASAATRGKGSPMAHAAAARRRKGSPSPRQRSGRSSAEPGSGRSPATAHGQGQGQGQGAGGLAGLRRVVLLEPNAQLHSGLAHTAERLGLVRAGASSPSPSPSYEIIRGSVLSIPLPNGSVDHVLCSLVLCSLPTPQAQAQAVAEMHRVLKPGGRLYWLEHVHSGMSSRPAVSRLQWILTCTGLWPWIGGGCRLDTQPMQAFLQPLQVGSSLHGLRVYKGSTSAGGGGGGNGRGTWQEEGHSTAVEWQAMHYAPFSQEKAWLVPDHVWGTATKA